MCLVSSVSEHRLGVLSKKFGGTYTKDNRGALEIEKCFVSVGKNLVWASE